MEEIKYWIWFSRIENLTPKLQLDLLQKFNTPQKLWNKKEEELIAQGISDKNVKKICEEIKEINPEEEETDDKSKNGKKGKKDNSKKGKK